MDFEKWMMHRTQAPEPGKQPAPPAVPTPQPSVTPVEPSVQQPEPSTLTSYFRKGPDSLGPVNHLVVTSFDPAFYRETYRDLSDVDDDYAVAHYWHVGWLEGRNPTSWFDTSSYLEMNEDVRRGGVNPFLHYVGWGRVEGRMFRKPVPLRQINQLLFNNPGLDWFALVAPVFDEQFYASQFHGAIPDHINLLAHYLLRGWKENRLPYRGYAPTGEQPQMGELSHFVPPIVSQLFSEQERRTVVRKVRARPVSVEPAVDETTEAEVEGPIQTHDSVPRSTPVAEITRDTAMGSPIQPARRQLIELEYIRNSLSAERMQAISSQIQSESTEKDVSSYEGEVRDIASEFDMSFYLATYPDVKEAGVDPVEHYFYTGWRERRDPATWFSTSFYLDSYPDVAAAEINPFWHYLVAGKNELRKPKKQASAKRDILETLTAPEQRSAGYTTPEHNRLGPSELKALLVGSVSGRDGLVWSSSHDCYPIVVGGTQIFIADEEQRFAALNIAYIHASPLRGALLMNETAPDEALTRLVMNGLIVGVATDAEIAAAIEAVDAKLPDDRTYVVHSVLGHSLPGMLAIHEALRPTNAFYWLHDYSSLCSGFNLLRNEIEYCHAPPVGSQACNVCIFGQSRARHVDQISRLFDQCNFTVVSPSDVTMSIWKRSSQLPHQASIVLEHCSLDELRTFPDERAAEAIGTQADPVRVAYVGYSMSQKGWPTFKAIVEKTRGQGGYQFFHFAKPGTFTQSDNMTPVEAEVTPGDRNAMSELLAKHKIDLVVMAAPWPETFSYVLFEALAAGCDIITLPNSGNIASVVKKSGRGFVFADEQEIVEFFENYSAVTYVRARARYGIERGRLVHRGTTAAVHPKNIQGA